LASYVWINLLQSILVYICFCFLYTGITFSVVEVDARCIVVGCLHCYVVLQAYYLIVYYIVVVYTRCYVIVYSDCCVVVCPY